MDDDDPDIYLHRKDKYIYNKKFHGDPNIFIHYLFANLQRETSGHETIIAKEY